MTSEPGPPISGPADPSAALAELFAEDRKEHESVPPVGTAEYSALRARDRHRRKRASALLNALEHANGASAADLYHAAWLFNHGDDPDEARRAHELAAAAASGGHRPARWLAAAAFDRWCMYDGRPQKYGTQFVPDGERYRLWDVDPATTDGERAEQDVPPLVEQIRRAEHMTRTLPQPSLEHAPGWLQSAIARWRPRSVLPGDSPPST